MTELELWGGVECTVNRVGFAYLDQLERSGHASREDDIDAFHGLGLRTLRFPALWERVAPRGLGDADWRWTDTRLRRVRALGMRPIVGLVHHGSGPPGTSLLDTSFVDGLAAYAATFARRYPWVDAYTPVNEPNTTARFSALYGHWHPHVRDDASFCRALLVQCRAVVEAMRAVRAVNPSARLIQTDDAGRTDSTPGLRYQADFECERRWLAWDLLFGRVDPRHALWPWLRHLGIRHDQLDWFRRAPCPPDIVGVNYYVTSDRFLDERVDRYSPTLQGGNGRSCYVDVDAVRVGDHAIVGHEAVLREAWNRYGTAVALTEAHLGCTREEQIRWLMAAWRGAGAARAAGADVRAVCVWALLGSHDWAALVTRSGVNYEPGAFDVRSTPPRPTALASVVRALATSGDAPHPVLSAPGWWERERRVQYGASRSSHATARRRRPVLIVTGGGGLAVGFEHHCRARGIDAVCLDRTALSLGGAPALRRALARESPWAVIDASELVGVDQAEQLPLVCWRDHVGTVEVLCEALADATAIPLVTFSSDLVFDGRQTRPYVETDPPAPLSVYGLTRAAAERIAASSGLHALVIRTGALFNPWDGAHFPARCLASLRRGEPCRAAHDLTVSPAYVPHVVDATLDLLVDGERGIWHLTNAGATTWSGVATSLAAMAGLDSALVTPCAADDLGFVAPRPRSSALASVRGSVMPSLTEALYSYVQISQAVAVPA